MGPRVRAPSYGLGETERSGKSSVQAGLRVRPYRSCPIWHRQASALADGTLGDVEVGRCDPIADCCIPMASAAVQSEIERGYRQSYYFPVGFARMPPRLSRMIPTPSTSRMSATLKMG
jgi:hypothetical protein